MSSRYPGAPPGVVRLSQSEVEAYLRCGIATCLAKELPQRRTTVRMAIGVATARGAHEDLEAKIEHGAGLALRDIVDVAVADYERETTECEIPETKVAVAAGKDDAASAALVYGERVSPGLTDIVTTEEAIVVSVGDGLELAGRPDYITADGIGDLKTGQPWTRDRADRARQLTAYSLLHYGRLGEWPRRVWIDSIGRSSRGWSAERLWSSRTDGDRAGYVEILRRVRHGLEHGVYLPAPEGSWWCSSAWCAFWRSCPVVR